MRLTELRKQTVTSRGLRFRPNTRNFQAVKEVQLNRGSYTKIYLDKNPKGGCAESAKTDGQKTQRQAETAKKTPAASTWTNISKLWYFP